jgi:hypothetical protein
MRLKLPAVCKTRSGNFPVVIVSIDRTGCCVVAERAVLNEHEAIRLTFEGMEMLVGHISWADAERAGIVFARPLYAPVVDHLRRLHEG